jgi:hypothetical protein
VFKFLRYSESFSKDQLLNILGGSHSHKKQAKEEEDDDDEGMEADEIVQTIINTEATLNEKLEKSQLKLFSSSTAISSEVPPIPLNIASFLESQTGA